MSYITDCPHNNTLCLKFFGLHIYFCVINCKIIIFNIRCDGGSATKYYILGKEAMVLCIVLCGVVAWLPPKSSN